MELKKIIVCLLAMLVLSSCVDININYGNDTTFPQDVITEPVTEPITESAADETETIPVESDIKSEEVEKPFIVNKSTKKYHNEDCRYVGFMNEENKLYITSTPEKLQNRLYKPCSFCQE